MFSNGSGATKDSTLHDGGFLAKLRCRCMARKRDTHFFTISQYSSYFFKPHKESPWGVFKFPGNFNSAA